MVRQKEKLGGATCNQNQMQLFRDVLDECGFMDLGFVGPRFTWSKHFEDGCSIWERLDRGVANNAWFQKFPRSRLHHLHCDTNDCSPFLINLLILEPPPSKNNFKFEKMWLSDGRCGEIVEASWCSSHYGEGDNTILKKVERCGKDLNWRNQNIFGNVKIGINEKEKITDSSQKGSNDQWKQLTGKEA